ncbi:MAG: VWA domain-containing protein [Rhizobiales bacterium]|nr:VWA domain-containing protein [Hyphomicrobiales bacterium]
MAVIRRIGLAAAVLAAASGLAPLASAAEVRVETRLGQSAVVPGKTTTIYLRINLEGVRPETEAARTPVNVAIVVDRSGSMQGAKLDSAKEAAIMALSRLEQRDIAAIVAYNHEVDIVLPATRVDGHAEMIADIKRLTAAGRTALYAGTREGVAQVKKFLADNRVNRVILLSDGLANVGPSTPDELGALGREAVKDGISVTTIGLGLGYNEDLMAKLAYNSDGNHAFVEKEDDLVRIFNQEFGDVLSVVAQDVVIEINCHTGFRPKRVLGREAEIDGGRVTMRLNQLYGAQEKYVVLELEVPADGAAGDAAIADVGVRYRGTAAGASEQNVTSQVRGRLTRSETEAEASLDKDVMADVVLQVSNEVSEQAVRLRDQGQVEAARELLQRNAQELATGAVLYAAPALSELAEKNRADSAAIASEGEEWNKTRKALRARQHGLKTQQAY